MCLKYLVKNYNAPHRGLGALPSTGGVLYCLQLAAAVISAVVVSAVVIAVYTRAVAPATNKE